MNHHTKPHIWTRLIAATLSILIAFPAVSVFAGYEGNMTTQNLSPLQRNKLSQKRHLARRKF